jgi:hypothetical protein
MVDLEYEIDSYKIHIFSRQPESAKPVLALITLWKKDVLRGYLHFYPDGIDLPNPTYEKNRPGKPIRLRFHIYMFDPIRDMLESEKPLFIEYSQPPPIAVLRSGLEPIGEEEKLFLPK